tara:strand:+ start:911 stop:1156 length:246 start_codon:yes stop_codon:yes gene_type:complete
MGLYKIRRKRDMPRINGLRNEYGRFHFDPEKDEFEVDNNTLLAALKDGNMELADAQARVPTASSPGVPSVKVGAKDTIKQP